MLRKDAAAALVVGSIGGDGWAICRVRIAGEWECDPGIDVGPFRKSGPGELLEWLPILQCSRLTLLKHNKKWVNLHKQSAIDVSGPTPEVRTTVRPIH